MRQRILHVVSNVAHYANPTHPTGLWLSELTHAYDVFVAKLPRDRVKRPLEREAGIDGASASRSPRFYAASETASFRPRSTARA